MNMRKLIALAAVLCAATADALPSAAYFRTRPAKPEIDSGVFERDAARDLGEVDRIVKGEVEVVGVTWAFPSNRVDWLFDASAKKGPYNAEWTWQLNRMSFWTALARAYTRTGDEKYARAFAQQFSDWLKQTGGVPPERGYNNRGSPWRTIEEGIRLMGSWSVAFEAFRKSPAFTDELIIAFIKSAHAQARHLIAHRTGGNWLLMEMTGAYFFALDFPEFEDSESIRREALRVFSQAIKEQVLPDGLQYELSPNYHQVFYSSATRLYLRAHAFGFGHEIPKDFLDPLRLGTEGPLALVTPAFTLPNFNDTFTDPLASSFSAAAKIFPERRDFLWLVTNGREGEPPKGETASRYLPYSGFAAMRTDWTPDATYLAFDMGPLGMGHWHQDKLSFVLWKGNECLVFDDGGGQYESSRRRNYGLSGYDHNTLLVDGLAQNRSGPKRVTAPIDAGWRSTKDEDFAFGIYDQEFGPKRQKLATQRREITFDKKRDVITICDVAESADGKEHDYTLLFQLDTTNVVVSADGRRVRAEYGAGKKYALEMEIGGDGGERAEAVTGRLKPSMAGWFVGREYLVPMVRPATTVFVKAPKGKTHRFRTVLRATCERFDVPLAQPAKLSSKVQKTVAFLGGSITEMDGFRPRVMRALREKYPQVDFLEVAAGLSSTCSDAGAFRLEEDVLAKGTPDLFIVEAAVNDDQDGHFTSEHSVRGMEGTIRHVLTRNPSCAVVVALMVNRGQFRALMDGATPLHYAAHAKVAKHYGAALADVGSALAASAKSGGMGWKEYRDCHPSPAGCDLGAKVVMDAVARVFDPLATARARPLPPPLDAKSYFNGRFLPLKDVKLGEGWNVSRPDWKSIPGNKRAYFTQGPAIWSERAGAELEFSFGGTAVGLFLTAGPDAGDIEVSVDGGPFKREALRANYGSLHYPYVHMLADDLADGMHTVRLRVVPAKRHKGTTGTAVRIHRICIN